MEKSIAHRMTGCFLTVIGAMALVAHVGCSNGSGLPRAGGDSGAGDGKTTALDAGAGKDTGAAAGGSAGAGAGGAATGGSGGAAGSGGSIGTGGATSSSPNDGAAIDAPQPPPAGGTGGSAGGGGGGSGGSAGTTASGGSGGSAGSGGTGGSAGSGGSAGRDGGGSAGRDGGGSAGRDGGGTDGAAADPPRDGAVSDRAVDSPVDRPPDAAVDAPGCTTASSCPAPTSGNGTAVCQNGACGITCNTGYHRCGSACALNTSVNTCGIGSNACSPCPAPPANGSATCSGTPLACGFSCNAGYHPCGSTCVSNTSVNGCGASCAACPVPTNATGATCTGTSPVCGIVCGTGYHQCGSSCVANTSPTNCGAACSPCPTDPHGQRTCDGTLCGITCATGWHWCIDHCVDNTLTANCGTTSCTPCAEAAGATSTCTGNPLGCGLSYECTTTGYHLCSGICVAQSVDHCGSSCNACPIQAPDAGGSTSHAVCSTSGVCSIACNDSPSQHYHNCGGTGPVNCVNDLSPDTCGDLCTPCPGRPNGSASCDGTNCGVTCYDGYHQCGTGANATCVDSSSIDNCGTNCGVACTTDIPYAEATCDNGMTCGFACDLGYRRCGGGCIPNADSTYCGVGAACSQCADNQDCVDGVCTTPDASVP
jgi:hypothetical protein